MKLDAPAPVWLDFGDAAAASSGLLLNISAVVSFGDALWTASDEGRTIECLMKEGDAYRLHKQIDLNDAFTDLPGAADGDEADVESLDIVDGNLWVAGSHTNVRKKFDHQEFIPSSPTARLDPSFRKRPSRRLLGRLVLDAAGYDVELPGAMLPAERAGSLRNALKDNEFLKPFLDLPSKENGLDIEGLTVFNGNVLLGLRGPTLDSIAVVIGLKIAEPFGLDGDPELHILNMDGLAVRDMARDGASILILAGPVNTAKGPFRIYRWMPQPTPYVQQPEQLGEWPSDLVGKPEGLCRLDQNGAPGVLVVYDSPDATRIDGSRYRADWFAL